MVEKVETLSPAPDFITNQELEEGIVNGRITTFTITEDVLPYYQRAANKTNFEVEVIALPGQHYITGYVKPVRRRPNTIGQENKSPTTKSQDPVKEGSVAISLKRPKGVTNDIAFHAERQKIQPA